MARQLKQAPNVQMSGAEFHAYEQIEKKTSSTFYFATPHHSWGVDSTRMLTDSFYNTFPKGKAWLQFDNANVTSSRND